MEWFDKLREFVDAAEAKAKNAAAKGSAWLRSLADYIDSVASGAQFATGPDEEACSDLEGRLKGLQTAHADPSAPSDPKKLDPATLALIIQLALALIEAWRKRREPKPTP